MYNSKIRRGMSLLSASALSVGLVTAGIAVGNAGATSSDGVYSSGSTKTITIGATVPLTGPASLGFQDVSRSALSVFDYVNANGGVNGWKINYILKDDQYDLPGGPGTVAQTTALLNTAGGIFATVGSLGTPTQQQVMNTLKNAGIPQLFVNSGAHYWNDPTNYPTLYGFQTNYLAEGKIFGTYINASLKGKTVGFLGQNDDFGQDGLQGLKNGGVTPTTANTLWYGPLDTAFNKSLFDTQVGKLKAAGAKVVVLDTIPQATALVLKAAAKVGFKPTWIVSAVGSDPQTVAAAGAASGEAKAITLSIFPASTDTKNSWNVWVTKVLKAESGKTVNGVNTETFTGKLPLNGNQVYGAAWAVAFLEALYTATANNTTPTQSNIVSALNSTSFSTPAVLPLDFSSTNHQGLKGGYLVTVVNSTSTKALNTTVYSVDPSTQALTTAKLSVTAPAAWLH